MSQKRVLVIYKGGTIGMVHEDPQMGLSPSKLGELLPHLPGVERIGCQIDYRSVDRPQDSSNMGPADWQELALLVAQQYDAYDGFVILHGTDTMSWTASALSFMLENLGKPVVFTGSVLPIDVLRSDGRDNFLTALEYVINDRRTLSETAICFDSKLYRGNRAIKYSSAKFRAFVTPNYPTLAESGYNMELYTHYWLPEPSAPFRLHASLDARVHLMKFYPGLTPDVLEAQLSIPGLRAIVLETYGNGNLPKFPWLIESLRKAIDSGLIVLNITQCTAGKVQQGKYATSKGLKEIGVISGEDLTTASALTKLMYLLGKVGDDTAAVRRLLAIPLAGEMLGNARNPIEHLLAA